MFIADDVTPHEKFLINKDLTHEKLPWTPFLSLLLSLQIKWEHTYRLVPLYCYLEGMFFPLCILFSVLVKWVFRIVVHIFL